MRLIFQRTGNSGFSIAAAKVTIKGMRITYHREATSPGDELTLKDGDELKITDDAEPPRVSSLASLLSKPVSQVPPHAPTRLGFAPVPAASVLPGNHQALTLDGELCAEWPNASASPEAETEIKPRASVSKSPPLPLSPSPSLQVSKSPPLPVSKSSSPGSALPVLITALSAIFSAAAIAGIYGVADDAWRTHPNGAALNDGLLHAALFVGCCALAFVLGWHLRGTPKRSASRLRLPRGL